MCFAQMKDYSRMYYLQADIFLGLPPTSHFVSIPVFLHTVFLLHKYILVHSLSPHNSTQYSILVVRVF